ncbi:Gustatory receptor [Sergentomyia squamirostris]
MLSFRESLRFLLYFSRLCGLAPISVDFRGSGTISSSRLGIIYSILVAIAYGSFHVASSIFNLSEKEEHNIITNVINYYNRYSRLVLFWVCIGNALINQRRIIQTFNLIENVDKLFATELNIHSNHAKFSRLVFLEIFIYLLSVFALEWNNCLMYISGIGIFNNYCMSMCLIPLIVATADQILFINLVYLIKERLAIISGFLTTKQRRVIKVKEGHKINGHLLKTVHMLYHFEHEVENLKVKMVQSKNTRVYIKTASVGYSRLYEASNLLNCAYGIPNAYTIFIRFVSLTTLAYSSCMRVLRLDDNDAEHIKKVPGIIGWIMLNFTEMLIFCLMCHRMKEEAAIIGRQLQCFRVENCHAPDVDEAIGVFSHQIHHQRIEITPCGFFTVDLSFIFALIATVTTYIMILIQFDISQKQLVNQK